MWEGVGYWFAVTGQKMQQQTTGFGVHLWGCEKTKYFVVMSIPTLLPSCCSYLTLFNPTLLGKQPSVINHPVHPHNLWPQHNVHSPTNVSLEYSQKSVWTKHDAGSYIVREELFWGGTQQDGPDIAYTECQDICYLVSWLNRCQSREHHSLRGISAHCIRRGAELL